jgi:hypothetical protein
MANFRKDTQTFGPTGHDKTVYEVPMIATKDGQVVSTQNPFPVTTVSSSGGSGTAAFGELLTASVVPIVQLDALYGLTGDNAEQFQTYTALSGEANTVGNQFHVKASSTQYSYGVLRSKRFLRYRPGQGALARFTARFTQGIVNTEQRAGLFNQENAFMFGYNGTSFGILHSYGFKTEIVELKITTKSSTSANATIVLNGVSFTVALVNDATINDTAAKIATYNFTGWQVEQRDDTVIFLALTTGPKTGAYTFTNGTAVGAFTVAQTGVVGTDNWIPQSEWNKDKCDGSLNPITNQSNINLDPTKFQVFQIQYRWLGAGVINFGLEDPNTGNIIIIHSIHWVNRNTTLSVDNPSMKIGYVAYNLGGGVVEVWGGSMAMFIEGQVDQINYPKSTSHTISSGLTQNIFHHMLSINNPITHSGKINTREVIIQDMTVAVQSTDPVVASLYVDQPLATGTHIYTTQTNRLVAVSKEVGTISSTATPIIEYNLPNNGGQQFDLTKYRIVLSPGSTLAVAVSSTNSIANTAVSLTWKVD